MTTYILSYIYPSILSYLPSIIYASYPLILHFSWEVGTRWTGNRSITWQMHIAYGQFRETSWPNLQYFHVNKIANDCLLLW